MIMTASIIKYKEYKPKISHSVFIARGCQIIGNVIIDDNSSVWYNCVIRGDVDKIVIGKNTNIQDLTMIHCSRFNGGTNIGSCVTIGHSAVIHACEIQDFALVGMNATVMDNSVIEQYGFVAAGSLVAPNKIVRTKQLWAGVPAKYIRDITEQEMDLIQDSWRHYRNLANAHNQNI